MMVFVIVGLWNISTSSNGLVRFIEKDPTLAEIRNVNMHLQLRIYNVLSKIDPKKMNPDDVTMVFIDDRTHWDALGGTTPTDRAFLAKLISNLIRAKPGPRVIGLDVELSAPRQYGEGEDEATRSGTDEVLRKAVREANVAGIPVILPISYYDSADGRHLIPSIIDLGSIGSYAEECKQQSCAMFGHIMAPDDRRQIPIGVVGLTDAHKEISVDSFALALAKAKYGPMHIPVEISNLNEEPVFGKFLPETAYKSLSALDLEANLPAALALCSGQIVLIGGNWHELQSHGSQVDTHLSAAGWMSGLGLHANYTESLLQVKFAHEVPLWVDLSADLLLGLSIYSIFEGLAGRLRVYLLVLASLVPFLLAYLFLVAANVYLDFLFPVELFVLHVVYELVESKVFHRFHKHGVYENNGIVYHLTHL